MGNKSSKPLSEELTEHYEQEAPPYVMFMVAKEEIEKALAEGWKVTKIWRLMHTKGRIRCGYSTFARYIKDYIRQQPGNVLRHKSGEPGQNEQPKGMAVTPQGRVMPDWPKPGSAQSSGPKLTPGTYRGEMPVYGSKPKPEDFNKF